MSKFYITSLLAISFMLSDVATLLRTDF